MEKVGNSDLVKEMVLGLRKWNYAELLSPHCEKALLQFKSRPFRVELACSSHTCVAILRELPPTVQKHAP